MTLPELTLPKIDLPFDIPVLIHPSIDHFAIVLPVIVLLLEFYNLFAKRKSIGVFSFILLILTVVAFAAAYFTGVVDGKEAYDLLPTEGQDELKEHKLLGTYLMLATIGLLFFKLLAMTGKKLLKVLFFIVLLGFIAVTFNQGKEGGELVYEYGANVERVKALDDKLFDTQEALEESKEKPVSKSTDIAVKDKAEANISSSSEETMKIIETKRADVEKSVTVEKEEKNEALNISDNSKVIEVESLPIEVPEHNDASIENEHSMDATVQEEMKKETIKTLNSNLRTKNNTIEEVQNKPVKALEQKNISTKQEVIENNPVEKEKIQKEEIREEIKMPLHQEATHSQDQRNDTSISPEMPKIPTVPKVIEVKPSEGVELPAYEESIQSLSSDLEHLKIETH